MLSKRILVLVFLVVFLSLVGCIPSPAPPIAENQAPVIVSTPVITAKVGTEYIYNVKAIDPDEDDLTYSLIVKPNGMDINSTTGIISWIPISGQAGNNSVIVGISDGDLSDTQSFIIVVEKPCVPPCPPPAPPVNHVPIITSIPEDTAIVGVEYTYTIKATDQDGDAITYSLVDGPEGMTFDGAATVNWIPDEGQIGPNDVTVKASDGKKSITQSFTIVVEAVKLIGIEVIPNPMTLFVGKFGFFKVIAHYNNNTTKNVTWDCDCESKDNDIATLDFPSPSNVSRSVKAIAVGTVDIAVVYSPDGEIFTKTLVVTVTFPEYTYLQLCAVGDGVSELTAEQAHSGIYSVKFHTDTWDWTNKYALGIPVDIPLNEITELSYWRNGVVFDYAPPAVLLCIDANNDGNLDFDTCEALSYGTLGDDAIFGIEGDWADIGWSEVNGLTNSYWMYGGVFTVDKTGFHGGWVTYSSLQEFTGSGPIDPADHIMLIVIAGGNPDGDVYIDDITINGETYDLEPD